MYKFLECKIEIGAPVEVPYPWKESVRLQRNVIPLCYDLMIKPQFPNLLTGRERITVEVTEPTTYFAVHVKRLKVTNAKVKCVSDETVRPVVKQSFAYEPHDFWILEMERTVTPGTYILQFEYELSLRSRSDGFFQGNYTCQDMNASRLLLATKLKAMEARKVYPCFDEPDIRAKYKFTIVKPAERYMALTNAEMKEEIELETSEVSVVFKESDAIPTFLTGFIIADLKEIDLVSVENHPKENLTIRILALESKIDQAVLAKDISMLVTKYFIDYFQLPFPHDKLDLVTVPDFPVPTLGYWGFIVFTEPLLLYDARSVMINDKINLGLAVTREICRQWFGCLVTMRYWQEFWLVEGFIRLMQYKALEEGTSYCREWKVSTESEHVMVNVIHPVLDADAVAYSHPLSVSTENQEEKGTLDVIIYNKGFAVLRMLESWIGAKNFRMGVQKFLEYYNMASATAADFWKFINSENTDPEMSVEEVMDTWSKQAGYPILYAVRRANTWTLSQARFLVDQDSFCDANESPYSYKWDIPVTYITSNDSKPVLVWFKRTDECLKIISERTVSFVKFNHLQTGLYRVNYEGCLWRQFSQLLQQDHTKLEALDRSNLLDDVFYSAEAGETDYNYVFDMLKYLEKEKDYLPWATVSKNLFRLTNHLQNTPHYGLLIKYVRALIGKIYGNAEGQFSWSSCPSNSIGNRWLRVLIVEFAAISKLPECIADLAIKFKEWIKTGELPVHSDLMRILLKYGMREVGTAEDWDVVYSRYEKESNADIRSFLLECLANLKEHWDLFGVFDEERSVLRDPDYIPFLRHLSENPYVSCFCWAFLRNEWDRLYERFSSYRRELNEIIFQLAMKFNTICQSEEVEMFYKKHPEATVCVDTKRIISDKIQRNIRFLEMHGPVILSCVCVGP